MIFLLHSRHKQILSWTDDAISFGGSLVTLELTSLIPFVGSLAENPLAVKHLHNWLYMNVPTYLVDQNVHGPRFTTPKSNAY